MKNPTITAQYPILIFDTTFTSYIKKISTFALSQNLKKVSLFGSKNPYSQY